MSRTAKPVTYTDSDVAALQKVIKTQKSEQRMVKRATIILKLIEGKQIKDVATEVHEGTNTIIKWRDRFCELGMEGLNDEQRSGKPIIYDDKFRQNVLEVLQHQPPDGMSRWDGPAVAKVLDTSVDAVWRVLKKEGVQLSRQRSWCVSTDREFTEKAADIVGLYLAPPQNAIVICVDEKPSMQALSRTTGYVTLRNGKTVRAVKSTYRRNGTQNLFAALEVATGQIHGQTTKYKKRVDFLGFMDVLIHDFPSGQEQEYHVILDNYCIHKRCDEWLLKHPNIFFHYTPTSASWLNQVEIWFNIMTRKVLKGASFDNVKQLSDAIHKFIAAYNEFAEPFEWKKREVKGSQIRNTITNICI